METLSTTVMYKGFPVKVENGKVYLRSFGTTISNHAMHWSWTEVPFDKLNSDLQKQLKEKDLI